MNTIRHGERQREVGETTILAPSTKGKRNLMKNVNPVLKQKPGNLVKKKKNQKPKHDEIYENPRIYYPRKIIKDKSLKNF